MSEKLKNKVAIVTGAGSGIGRAISIALAEEKATVVLAARRLDKLKETAELVKNAGATSEIIITDLTDESSIKKLVRLTNENFGRLDILVNNAGVNHLAKLEETTTEDWQRCFNVNARGPFILCREALPLLKKAKTAHIINIASAAAVRGYPLLSAYTASKHALRGMTISLAEELKDSGIRVHILCTGGVDTDMVSQVRPDIKKQELMAPKEIAELVVYLLTHKGNAVIDELHIRRASSNPWF